MVASNGALAADLASASDSSGARLKLKPEKHDFGGVTETQQSAPLTVTATNKSGAASIVFSSIVASAPFEIQTDGCSGVPLDAGKSCEVQVRFHPTSVGHVKDKKGLTFTDSGKKSPQQVALEGDGIPLTPTATPTMTPTPSATPTPTISPSPTPSTTRTASGTATATPSPPPTATPSLGATPTSSTSATATSTPTVTCTPNPHPTPFVAGLVLIAGGQASDGTALNSAEVFNPATNMFTLTTAPALGGSNMNDGRYSHAAAAVATNDSAEVLVTGGFDATGVAKSTESFSFSTNQFSLGPEMSDSRQGHTATFLLGTTNVLVAGGKNASGTVLRSAEIIGAGAVASTMNAARVNAAASVEKLDEFFMRDSCPDRALITGGSDGVSALQSAELFDPNANTFTLTDDVSLGGNQMNAARVFHTATLVVNSGNLKILITGGEGVAGVAQASAEIFDVASDKFTLTTDLGGTAMNDARAKHTATAIGPAAESTTVLIAGGIDSSGNALATAEVFDLSTNSFTKVGSMHSARFDHAAALLSNGKILITGGEDGSGTTLNTAEIFDPVTNQFTLTTDASLGGNNMNVARKLHTATAY